ncbi:MAG TPA: SRPBCC domain-containing protein [Mycobacteriales bacterium]|nr:SRPBCC domain-containing protein [Mycobacteriales bacterium]
MTRDRHGSAVVEFPNELEIVVTRDFDAPIQLVFDVFTKVEHVRKTFAPFGEEVTVCSIDLRVGGDYHYVMVTDDGVECSFGTFLEVEPPNRTVQTWLFEGWPDAHAVETMSLHEVDGVTRLSWKLAFRDKAGRAHMTKFDGVEAQFETVAGYLQSLVGSR